MTKLLWNKEEFRINKEQGCIISVNTINKWFRKDVQLFQYQIKKNKIQSIKQKIINNNNNNEMTKNKSITCLLQDRGNILS